MKAKEIYIGMIINNWKIVSERYSKKTISGNSVLYVKALCLNCNIEYEMGLNDILRGHSKQCKECTNPRRYFSKVYTDEYNTIIEVEDIKENKVYFSYVDLQYFWELVNFNFGLVFSKSNKPYLEISGGIGKAKAPTPKRLHRYICFLEYGEEYIKGRTIDHKDKITLNNRLNNLNVVGALENAQNHSLRKDNTTSVTGVSIMKSTGRWIAYINIENKRIWLGDFNTFEEAKEVRERAEIKHHTYVQSIKYEQ